MDGGGVSKLLRRHYSNICNRPVIDDPRSTKVCEAVKGTNAAIKKLALKHVS